MKAGIRPRSKEKLLQSLVPALLIFGRNLQNAFPAPAPGPCLNDFQIFSIAVFRPKSLRQGQGPGAFFSLLQRLIPAFMIFGVDSPIS